MSGSAVPMALSIHINDVSVADSMFVNANGFWTRDVSWTGTVTAGSTMGFYISVFNTVPTTYTITAPSPQTGYVYTKLARYSISGV